MPELVLLDNTVLTNFALVRQASPAPIRLMTSRGVLVDPLEPREAIGHIRSWLERPQVQILQPESRHLELLDSLMKDAEVSGKHTTDAHLAALAIEHQVELHFQDVNQIVEVVADQGQLHIAYLWAESSRDERLLILVTKELLEHEGLASLQAVYRYLSARGVEPGDLPEALRRLRRKEILTEEAGQLSFRIDILRRWLDRHHDLESFALSERAAGSTVAN